MEQHRRQFQNQFYSLIHKIRGIMKKINRVGITFLLVIVCFIGRTQDYAIQWTDALNLGINDSALFKTYYHDHAWNAEAYSSTVLRPDSNGYIEYKVSDLGNYKAFGFAEEYDEGHSYTGIDYGFYTISNNTAYRVVDGVHTSIGTVTSSDTLKVDRMDTTVTFLFNDSVIHTVEINQPTKDWYVDGLIYTYYTGMKNIRSNFNTLRFRESSMPVTTVYANDSGKIDVTYIGGVGPYTYSWSNGDTIEDIDSVAQGFYTLTIKDSRGDSIVKEYGLFPRHKVEWDELIALDSTNNKLYKQVNYPAGWNAEAISSKALQPDKDGEIYYKMTSERYTHDATMWGFTDVLEASTSHSDIKYGFYTASWERVWVRHEGVNVLIDDRQVDNAEYSIYRKDSIIIYKKNNIELYRDTISAPTKEWCAAALIYGHSRGISDMRISFDKESFHEPETYSTTNHGNGQGSIDVSFVSEDTPLTYNWSNGDTVQDLDSVAFGFYQLTVKNSLGDSLVREYSVYPDSLIEWTDLIGFYPNGTIIQKGGNAPGGWNCQAKSARELKPTYDGQLTYTVNSWSHLVNNIIGFSDQDNSKTFSDIKYGFYFVGYYRLYIIVDGTYSAVDVFRAGDEVSIKRNGNTVKWYRNQREIWSENISAPTSSWWVEAMCYSNSRDFDGPKVSFHDRRFREESMATTSIDGNGLGTIDVNYTGGIEPYSYSWSNGDTTESISGVPQGRYTLTISDSLDSTYVKEYPVYSKSFVTWTDLNNATVSATHMYKTGSTAGWNSEAISEERLSPAEDGFIEYAAVQTNANQVIGFANGANTVTTISEIEYGFYLANNKNLYYILNGTQNYIDQYLANDVLRIERIGNKVYWKNDGVILHEETITPPTEDWYADGLNYWTSSVKITNLKLNLSTHLNLQSFARTGKKVSGSYYHLKEDELRFTYDEQYVPDNTALDITITDDGNTSYTYSGTIQRGVGERFYTLDLDDISPSLTSGYYVLTIENDKSEKSYLRFKLD